MMARFPMKTMKPFLVVSVGDYRTLGLIDFDTLDEAVVYAIESEFVCHVIYATEGGLNVEEYS